MTGSQPYITLWSFCRRPFFALWSIGDWQKRVTSDFRTSILLPQLPILSLAHCVSYSWSEGEATIVGRFVFFHSPTSILSLATPSRYGYVCLRSWSPFLISLSSRKLKSNPCWPTSTSLRFQSLLKTIDKCNGLFLYHTGSSSRPLIKIKSW